MACYSSDHNRRFNKPLNRGKQSAFILIGQDQHDTQFFSTR